MQRALPEIITQLGQEHLNARRTLNTLEREVDAAAQYHMPDFDIIEGVVAFFHDYAAKHHAIEELIYQALRRRLPFRAGELSTLSDEHREAGTRLAQFAEASRYGRKDIESSRHAFCRAARDFIALERNHIRREETRFFVYALEHLTDDDWHDIHAVMGNPKWRAAHEAAA